MNIFMQHSNRQCFPAFFAVKFQNNGVVFIPSALKTVGIILYTVSIFGAASPVKSFCSCIFRSITYAQSELSSEFSLPGCLKSRKVILNQIYRMRLNNIDYVIQKLLKVILPDIKAGSVFTGCFQLFRHSCPSVLSQCIIRIVSRIPNCTFIPVRRFQLLNSQIIVHHYIIFS